MIAASLRSTAWFATTILRVRQRNQAWWAIMKENNRKKYLSSEWFSLDQTRQ
jgi:hypothetical protein